MRAGTPNGRTLRRVWVAAVEATLILLVAACAGGTGDNASGTATSTGDQERTGRETSSGSETTTGENATAEEESDPVLDEASAQQACLNAWIDRMNRSVHIFFFFVSNDRSVRRVSVGFGEGGACLISFAGNTGSLLQVLEVNPPSGEYTALLPLGRVEDFDPRPVGWNASANARGYVMLKRNRSAPTRLERSIDSSVFPSADEDKIMSAVPDQGWQCQRADRRSQGSVAGVLCDPTEQISVRYESFSNRTALDDAYWGYFAANAKKQIALGRLCNRHRYAEGILLTSEEEKVGRILCYPDGKGHAVITWKHDGLLILAHATGGNKDGLVRWFQAGGGRLG
jgi:hypothetical protein